MKGLTFNHKVLAACERILEHDNATTGDREFVNGVIKFGNDAGFLTGEQARALGKTSKRVVHDNKFVKHDWWD